MLLNLAEIRVVASDGDVPKAQKYVQNMVSGTNGDVRGDSCAYADDDSGHL